MKTVSQPWDWWAYRLRVRHRPTHPGIQVQDATLIEAIVEALDLRQPGLRILDLACGSGVHALMLAQRGAVVTGLDIAPSLVAYDNEQARLKGLADQARFVVGDMRKPPFRAAFDAVTILGTSFGFFDEAGNQAVLAGAAEALVPGGRLLIDLEDLWALLLQPHRSWSEFDDGIFLIESRYDAVEATYHGRFRYIDADGVMNTYEDEETLRAYTVPELRTRLKDAGFTDVSLYGASTLPLRPYDANHYDRMLVVATL
jgi:SAM-dependent methyltransferase